MKFSKKALLKAVDTEIAARTKAAESAYQTAVQEYEQAKVEWLASEHPAALAATAKAVAEKIRKGRVVTADDLKAFGRRSYKEDHAFSGVRPNPETRLRKPNVAKLEALRDFLATVTDDEITSTGLREVGFRNLADILRKAASL